MTDNKYITVNMSIEMYATLTSLVGLSVAVMQHDDEVAQSFATLLSAEEVEPIAHQIVDLLQSISRDMIDGQSGPVTPKIQIVS
jgi:hypothetical protein